MPIEEHIRVTGAEQAAQGVDRVAQSTQRAGEATGKAGVEGEAAGRKLGVLGSIMETVRSGAMRMITGFLGLAAIKTLFDGLIAALEKMRDLQDEIAGRSVGLAGSSKLLARQLGVGEQAGMDVLTKLRVAGGLDAATAQAFGISADVALGSQGGLLKNMPVAEKIAGFVGAKGLSADEAGKLMELLKTSGALESPEAAAQAIAQISAAATASRATSVGEFVAQVQRGGTSLIQQGVPLTDVLTMAGQSREVEVSGELAAQSMEQLGLAATGAEKGFGREIDRVARAQGLDPRTMSNAQRIAIARQILGGIDSQAEENRIRKMMGPERGARLIKAFRGSTVAATAGVGAAAAGATAADFERTVEQGRQEMTFREQQNLAAAEHEEAVAGMEEFTLAQARKRAEAKRKIAVARGTVREVGGPASFFGLGRSAESIEEEFMVQFFQERAAALKEQGLDVSEAEGLLSPPLGLADPGATYGYDDAWLRRVGRALDKAQGRRPVIINNTYIGTNLNGPNPEARPAVIPDIGE